MGTFKMFENSSCNMSPQIQELITLLTRQEDVGHESRKVQRETVVCPVTIQPQYELERFRGFTKDLSSGGVCLITQDEMKVEQIATLAIYTAPMIFQRKSAHVVFGRNRLAMTSTNRAGDFFVGYFKT